MCGCVYIWFCVFFVIASWFLFFFNVITANDGLTTVIIDHWDSRKLKCDCCHQQQKTRHPPVEYRNSYNNLFDRNSPRFIILEPSCMYAVTSSSLWNTELSNWSLRWVKRIKRQKIKQWHSRSRFLGSQPTRDRIITWPKAVITFCQAEVTFPAMAYQCPQTSTKLYCLATVAHWCE